jgi:proliferating cell nuclear antigen
MTEFQMFDHPGAEVAEITTNGGVIKPFLNAIAPVADEAKLTVSADGLWTRVVDPANVFMVEASLDADAFEEYTINADETLGVNIGALQSTVRRARKNHDDELTLSVQERELSATVRRGYDNCNVVSQGSVQLLDPDSIRQEPDMPDVEFDVQVETDADALIDAMSYSMGVADYIRVSAKGVNQHTSALYMAGETDTREESVAIDNVDTDESAESLYATDYMNNTLTGISATAPDTVAVAFGEEFPITFEMESADIPLTVKYFQAPRIQS